MWRLVVHIDLLLTTRTGKPGPHVVRYIPSDVGGAAESGTLLMQLKISIHHLLGGVTPVSPSSESRPETAVMA